MKPGKWCLLPGRSKNMRVHSSLEILNQVACVTEMTMEDPDIGLEIQIWELSLYLGKQFSMELLKHQMEDIRVMSIRLRIDTINKVT